MKPRSQPPPSRMGRRDFVALTSAAALAGGAMFAGAAAEDGMDTPRDRRIGNRDSSGAIAARRWAARPLPTDDAFLGSSPMLGGASPLGILPRNVRGRQRAVTGPSQSSARNG